MKGISDAFRAQIVGTDVNLAMCVKITRTDTVIFAFTGHNKSLTVGGVSYEPLNGASITSMTGKSDMGVDAMKTLTLTSTDISEADLIAGLWDNSTIEVFGVIWSDLSAGTIPFKRGRIGEVEVRQTDFFAEVLSLTKHLNQDIVEFTSLMCRADLGDIRCQVDLEPAEWTTATAMTAVQAGDYGVGSRVSPTTYNGRQFKCSVAGTTGGLEPTWNTTVGGTTIDSGITWITELALTMEGVVSIWYNRYSFISTGLDPAADVTNHFKYGLLTWLTGANTGYTMEVREYETLQKITLWDSMPFDLAVGDTFKVHIGCAKRFTEDCSVIFDNGDNFQGENFLPGPDEVALFPDAK